MLLRLAPWITLAVLVLAQVGLWLASDPAPDADPSKDRAEQEELGARLEQLERRIQQLGARLEARSSADAGNVDDVERIAPGSTRDRADETDDSGRLAALEARVQVLESSVEAPRAADPRRLAALRALNDALAEGRGEDARRLLATGLDLDARDEDRRTPLAAASIAGDLEMIDLLLDHGAGLERRAGRRSMTPLLAALDAEQEAAALHLLDRGAAPTAVDKNGESALSWASYNDMPRVVEALLSRGAPVDAQCHSGRTALADAVSKGHASIAALLLQNGADPNLGPAGSPTPLQEALEAGDEALAALLRQYGAR